MKNLFILIILYITSYNLFAETFRIVEINTPHIFIDKKLCKVDDTFKMGAKIQWESDRQAMKVIYKNQLFYASPILFKKYKAKDFWDFITVTKANLARTSGSDFPLTEEDHRLMFKNCFILTDSISFATSWLVDDNSFFTFISNNLGENNFSLQPNYVNNQIIIDRESITNSCAGKQDIIFTVRYIEKECNNSLLITDSLNIIVLPKSLPNN